MTSLTAWHGLYLTGVLRSIQSTEHTAWMCRVFSGLRTEQSRSSYQWLTPVCVYRVYLRSYRIDNDLSFAGRYFYPLALMFNTSSSTSTDTISPPPSGSLSSPQYITQFTLCTYRSNFIILAAINQTNEKKLNSIRFPSPQSSVYPRRKKDIVTNAKPGGNAHHANASLAPSPLGSRGRHHGSKL